MENSLTIVGTTLEIDWTNDERRLRFKGQYFRVMYVNQHGLLVSPDETAPLQIVEDTDGRPLFPDARPVMVWFANDGDIIYKTNVGVDLTFFDARPGTPVFDPDTGDYWEIEEFFDAYFQENLAEVIPLNLLSEDFAQEILSSRFQRDSVIILERCQQDSFTTFIGEPLKVMGLTQTGVLCVPHAGCRPFVGLFIPFNGVAVRPAPVGSYSFPEIVEGDIIIYSDGQSPVEEFFPKFFGLAFNRPSALERTIEKQIVIYEPSYVVEEYVPYWVPEVIVEIDFGFDGFIY